MKEKEPTALERIAAGMIGTLKRQAEGGALTHRLSRGLVLVLERKGDQWRLACGRRDAVPGTEEIWIVSRAFGVPIGTLPTFEERNGFKVAEFLWIEREPATVLPPVQQSALIHAPQKGY